MEIVTQIVREETYSFTPNDGSHEVFIRSGALREWLLKNAMDKVIDVTFPVEPIEQIYERHGVEPARMKTMTLLEAGEPLILGEWGRTHILIDGGHRRAFWALRGTHNLRGWCVPRVVWEQFTFDPRNTTILHWDNTGMSALHRNKN